MRKLARQILVSVSMTGQENIEELRGQVCNIGISKRELALRSCEVDNERGGR